MRRLVIGSFRKELLAASVLVGLLGCFPYTTHAQTEEIVMNEIQPDGAEGTEWIELYNAGTIDVSLQNWKLKDDNSRDWDDITIEADVSLETGEYWVTTEQSNWLNDGGDTLTLKDEDGNRIDRVSYSGEDGDGASYTFGRFPDGEDTLLSMKASRNAENTAKDVLQTRENNLPSVPSVLAPRKAPIIKTPTAGHIQSEPSVTLQWTDRSSVFMPDPTYQYELFFDDSGSEDARIRSGITKQTEQSVSDLDEGTYRWRVRTCTPRLVPQAPNLARELTDTRQCSEWSEIQTFAVDMSAPRVSLDPADISEPTRGDVSLQARVSDAHWEKTENTFEFTATHEEQGEIRSFSSLNSTWQTSAEDVPDGIYTVRFLATDQAGNTSRQITRTFTVDNTPPEVSFTTPITEASGEAIYVNADSWTGKITGTVKDKTSEVEGIDLRIRRRSDEKYWDGDEWRTYQTSVQPTFGRGTWTYDFSEERTAGTTYEITAVAQDNAGNQTDTKTATLAYDTEEPEIDVSDSKESNGVKSWYQNPVDMDIFAEDMFSGVNFLSVEGISQNRKVYNPPFEVNFSFDANGRFSFTSQAQDKAGNTQNKESTVRIDSRKPELSLEIPSQVTTAEGVPLLSGEVSGTASVTPRGEAHVAQKGLNVLQTDTVVQSLSLAESTFGPWQTSAVEDGAYTLRLEAEDQAGNRAQTAQKAVVDNTAPDINTLPQVFNAQQKTYVDTARWDIDVSDSHGVKEVNAEFVPEAENTSAVTVVAQKKDEVWTLPVNTEENKLKEGTYDVTLTATDRLGNTRRVESQASLVIDETRPDLSISNISSVTRDTLNLAGTVTDNTGLPTKSVRVTVNNISKEVSPGEDGAWQTEMDVTDLPEGEHTVTVSVRDRAGNENVQTANVRIDRSAPQLTVTQPETGRIVQNVNMSGEVKDTRSELKTVSIKVLSEKEDRVAFTKEGVSVTDNEWHLTVPNENLQEGTPYTIRVKAEDEVGNTVTEEKNDIWLDISAPEVAFQTPASSGSVTDTVEIQTTVSDAISEQVDTWTLRARHISNGKTYEFDSLNPMWQTDTADISDGVYRLELQATDKAGNQSNRVTRTITVDNSAPEITALPDVFQTEDRAYVNQETWKMEITDIHHNVEDVSLQFTPIQETENTVTFDVQGNEKGRQFLLNQGERNVPDGTYNVTLTASDALGHTKRIDTQQPIVIDKTKPEVDVSDISSVVRDTLSLSGTVTDRNMSDEKAVRIRMNDIQKSVSLDERGRWQTEIDVSKMAEDLHTLNIGVTDRAGNTRTQSAQVRIDTSKPTMEIEKPNANDRLGELSVAGTVTDKRSNVNAVSVKVISEQTGELVFQSQNVSVTDNEWHLTVPNENLQEGMPYTIRVKAEDGVENTVTKERNDIRIDATKPSVELTKPVSDTQETLVIQNWDHMVVGKASDAATDIQAVEMKLVRGSDTAVWTPNGWEKDVQFPPFVTVGETDTWRHRIDGVMEEPDTYTVSVRSQDKAGNYSSVRSYTFVQDGKRPEVEWEITGSESESRARTISWEASAHSGIERYMLTYENTATGESRRQILDSDMKKHTLSELESGVWDITLTVRDKAGNTRTLTDNVEVSEGPYDLSFENDVSEGENLIQSPSDLTSDEAEDSTERQNTSDEEEISERSFAEEDREFSRNLDEREEREGTSSGSVTEGERAEQDGANSSQNEEATETSDDTSPDSTGEITEPEEASERNDSSWRQTLQARLRENVPSRYVWGVGGLGLLLVLGGIYRRIRGV